MADFKDLSEDLKKTVEQLKRALDLSKEFNNIVEILRFMNEYGEKFLSLQEQVTSKAKEGNEEYQALNKLLNDANAILAAQADKVLQSFKKENLGLIEAEKGLINIIRALKATDDAALHAKADLIAMNAAMKKGESIGGFGKSLLNFFKTFKSEDLLEKTLSMTWTATFRQFGEIAAFSMYKKLSSLRSKAPKETKETEEKKTIEQEKAAQEEKKAGEILKDAAQNLGKTAEETLHGSKEQKNAAKNFQNIFGELSKNPWIGIGSAIVSAVLALASMSLARAQQRLSTALAMLSSSSAKAGEGIADASNTMQEVIGKSIPVFLESRESLAEFYDTLYTSIPSLQDYIFSINNGTSSAEELRNMQAGSAQSLRNFANLYTNLYYRSGLYGKTIDKLSTINSIYYSVIAKSARLAGQDILSRAEFFKSWSEAGEANYGYRQNQLWIASILENTAKELARMGRDTREAGQVVKNFVSAFTNMDEAMVMALFPGMGFRAFEYFRQLSPDQIRDIVMRSPFGQTIMAGYGAGGAGGAAYIMRSLLGGDLYDLTAAIQAGALQTGTVLEKALGEKIGRASAEQLTKAAGPTKEMLTLLERFQEEILAKADSIFKKLTEAIDRLKNTIKDTSSVTYKVNIVGKGP